MMSLSCWMAMTDLKEGEKYNVNFVDDDHPITCIFKKHHRGFLIFVDENAAKVVCRPSSISKIEKV